MRGTILALTVYAAPVLAFAATPKTFGEFVNMVINIFNALTALLVLAAVVLYLLNITTGIGKTGERRGQMYTVMLWGMLAIFLMVSIWGILRILQTTLFGTDTQLN